MQVQEKRVSHLHATVAATFVGPTNQRREKWTLTEYEPSSNKIWVQYPLQKKLMFCLKTIAVKLPGYRTTGISQVMRSWQYTMAKNGSLLYTSHTTNTSGMGNPRFCNVMLATVAKR